MNLKKILIFALLILLLTSYVFSQYYADIKIDVEDNGLVNIYGNSNYKELLTTNSQNLTSKKGNIWTLNIQTNDLIDNFIFELKLPKHSQITYIKTTPTFRIDEENNHIKIIGTGENKPLTLIVQYSINPTSDFFSENNIILFLSGLLSIFIIFIVYIIIKTNIKEKNIKKDIQKIIKDSSKQIRHKEIKEKKPKFDYSILSERQQEIIKILKKEKKITQKQLEQKLKIPKSSVSRNINALLQKKIINKEQAGISNYISLNKNN